MSRRAEERWDSAGASRQAGASPAGCDCASLRRTSLDSVHFVDSVQSGSTRSGRSPRSRTSEASPKRSGQSHGGPKSAGMVSSAKRALTVASPAGCDCASLRRTSLHSVHFVDSVQSGSSRVDGVHGAGRAKRVRSGVGRVHAGPKSAGMVRRAKRALTVASPAGFEPSGRSPRSRTSEASPKRSGQSPRRPEERWMPFACEPVASPAGFEPA